MQGQALQASFVPNNFIIIFMWGIIADYMFLAVGKYGCVFELAGFAKKFEPLHFLNVYYGMKNLSR